MKTTKIMKRQMGEYEVLQRTSDSYFRADDLPLKGAGYTTPYYLKD
jgi:hypothetical protein